MINKFKRPNTMAGVYISRASDKELIQEFKSRFAVTGKSELVETYNEIKNIFGVHAQMVYLYVLHKTFLEKFGESPFLVEDEILYCLGPKIYYSAQLDSIFLLAEN